MRRATRFRLGLLGVLALLGALVWWTTEHHPAAPTVLLTLDPTAITRVNIDTREGPLRSFEKRDGHWWMLTPQQGRADDAHLARLTEIAAAEVLRWRPASDFNGADIGLEPPFAILHLDDVSLRFGDLSALAPQRYVRVGEHVALVPARFGVDLAATPDSELLPSTD